MHNSKSQDKIIDSVFKDLQYKGAPVDSDHLWHSSTAELCFKSMQFNSILFYLYSVKSEQRSLRSLYFVR